MQKTIQIKSSRRDRNSKANFSGSELPTNQVFELVIRFVPKGTQVCVERGLQYCDADECGFVRNVVMCACDNGE